ncbi:MAG: hypothetical protein ACKV2Q_36665 [Planctomycetaceae bacterium]
MIRIEWTPYAAAMDERLASVALDPANKYLLATTDAAGMREYFEERRTWSGVLIDENWRINWTIWCRDNHRHVRWPLPNLAVACVCRTQAELDRDWPILLSVPAAKLGAVIQPTEAVDLWSAKHEYAPGTYMNVFGWGKGAQFTIIEPPPPDVSLGYCTGCSEAVKHDTTHYGQTHEHPTQPPVNVAWLRSLVEQARAAGVAVSVASEWPNLYEHASDSDDGRGGKLSSLPADLRIDEELWTTEATHD